MKAINLIPLDERRGGSGTGRSGGAVYAVLGVLGVLLVVLAAYAVLARQVADRETRLAELKTETARVSVEVEALRPFGEFAELRTQRVAALQTLAGARVDWSRVLADLSVALPADARLSSLNGSVAPAPDAAAPAGGAAPAPADAAAPAAGGPSLQLAGCTTGDRAVAQMLVRLRQMSGVRSVDLASATEDEASATEGAPASCDTAFQVSVSFAPLPGAAAAGVPATAAVTAPAPAEGGEPADGSAGGEATPAEPSGDEEKGQ